MCIEFDNNQPITWQGGGECGGGAEEDEDFRPIGEEQEDGGVDDQEGREKGEGAGSTQEEEGKEEGSKRRFVFVYISINYFFKLNSYWILLVKTLRLNCCF